MDKRYNITYGYRDWVYLFNNNPYYVGVLEELDLMDSKLEDRLSDLDKAKSINDLDKVIKRIKKLLKEAFIETERFYYCEAEGKVTEIPEKMKTLHLETARNINNKLSVRINKRIKEVVKEMEDPSNLNFC